MQGFGDGHTDNAYSPLTVGAPYGVTLENLVNGYVPYGNGGTQYKAHLVSKLSRVPESIYENDGDRKRLSAAKPLMS
ncbi:MAG: hypothetical protein ACLUOF_09915 [Ruminococcus sp.]